MDGQHAPGLKPKIAGRIRQGLNPSLHSGERLIAIASVTNLRPVLDGFAVTTGRLIGFNTARISQKGPTIAVSFPEIERVDYAPKFGGTHITVTLKSGEAVRMGSVMPVDAEFVRESVDAAREAHPRSGYVAPHPVGPAANSSAPPEHPKSEAVSLASAASRLSPPRIWSAPRIAALAFAILFTLSAIANAFDRGMLGVVPFLIAVAIPLAWAGLVTPIRRRRAQKNALPAPKTSGRMKAAITAVSVGLVIVAVITDPEVEKEPDTASVLASSDDEDSADPNTSTTTSIATSSAPLTATELPTVAFDKSMVRALGVSKENKGGQSDVRFVAGSDDLATLNKLTEQCVDHYLKETKAAYCYAYGSDKDYELKTFDWTPEFDTSVYGGSRPCWTHYAGQPLSGRDSRSSQVTSGVSYLAADCPGTVAFPDPDGSLATERSRRTEAKAVNSALKPRDPCKLVDVDALAALDFKTVLGNTTDDPTAYLPEGAVASYSCTNSELELGLTVTEYRNAQLARNATAEITGTPNSFLLGSGGFVTDIAGGAGSAVINEELGISEAYWANGQYGFAVTLNSIPPVKGLSTGQPASALVKTLTTIAATANERIATENW